ncbi:hypothetical protein MKW94_004365 [Papaver nudicaule]|uniref:Bifunctional inhibitor/plant lipid transfer protein/seed storage helical domain-containing protein n=1 Tax=Papaver nudicaule TaxID=74823 RepID=A0AA41S8H9_PAPNU|nr:hypothetical protein [Papaver nudicaule]
MKMVTVLFVLCSLLMLEPAFSADATPPNIQEQCTSQFGKVGACLTFATGNGTTPTPECCAAVKDIRQHQAVCLCYIILETHKGESSIKDMELLNLSPTSPDYAFFTNISSPATPTTPAASSSTAVPAAAKAKSMGSMHGPPSHLAAIVIFVTGFISLFMV